MSWPIVLVLIAGLAWFASRSSKIVADAAATMCLMNFLDMWKDRMKTIIDDPDIDLAADRDLILRSNRAQAIVNPIEDVMQTMSAFVYLIPVAMLFGIREMGPDVLEAPHRMVASVERCHCVTGASGLAVGVLPLEDAISAYVG